ncbi:HpcH/HpaI aldolase/citrate lyase family protein [Cupriavidus sp. D39]|uniref:HpcH/HpaI aldolase/citrate lyase family protein n=1 Tax=Cupriavidus sp. D39 TaxID=2997877 RepID=UPI0022701102|nr:CoA ester lyase [Cupriavidus sp. D39]MCY0855533.1 CoA ester lyase [Cupriavidus sp. D39]
MATAAFARSYLFVPANRPERFAKANASGADAVILDLEDAVSDEDKDRARGLLEAYLAGGGAGMVRINATQTQWFEHDLCLCGEAGVTGVVLPKAESAADVALVAKHLRPGVKVLPLIETARGMANINEVAGAPGVDRLVFGTVDFRTEMGIEGDDQELLFFRSMLVLASRVARIAAPVDGVTVAIADVDELRNATERGRRLGFGAKLCIHPAQVAEVNGAYRPTEAQLAWAARVVEQARSGPGAFQLDGEMIDAPVIARAVSLLERAGRAPA